MNMNRAGLPRPSVRRNDQRDHNRGEPLANHQSGKQLICVATNFVLLSREQFLGSLVALIMNAQPRSRSRDLDRKCVFYYFKHGPCFLRSVSEQPKTNVFAKRLVPLLIRDTSELSPALSPACPRDAVMPPLQSRWPFRSKSKV